MAKKNPTRKTAPKRAAKSTAAPKAAANRGPRFGPTDCHAPGCDGQRYLKGSLLCRDHQKAWAAGTFRLSQRGYDRLNAARVAAGQKPVGDPAAVKRAKAAAKSAPAPTPAGTTDDELEATLAASVSRFATPELARAARAKRQGRKS